MKIIPLTPEEIAWANRQPIIGKPSFTRLREQLTAAGISFSGFTPTDDRQDVRFIIHQEQSADAPNDDALMRLLIRVFRSSGMGIGFEDILLEHPDPGCVHVTSSTTSVNIGPPEPWQLPVD